jgi:integral membrane protein (TIGR01906 family)
MEKPPTWLRVVHVVLVPFVAVWLISVSFMFLLVPTVTHLWAERSVDDVHAAVSHEQLITAADAGLAYVNGSLDVLPYQGSDERTSFTPDVVSHMTDVRNVIGNVKILVAVLTVFVIAGSYLLMSRNQPRRLTRSWSSGALLAVVLCAALAIFGVLNFDALFTAMHEVIFAGLGNWTFSADSLLICTYPIVFWISMAATWAGILLALSLLVIAWSLWNNRRHRSDKKDKTTE